MPSAPELWVPSLDARPSVGTLIYFEFRARGEPPHLCAAYLGHHLDNARLPFSEYGWMKRTSPNGLCPWIVLPDGRAIAETLDICLLLASLPSPEGRVLAQDSAQLKLFELSNTPPLMHWPDNSNPENCAWLLNMYKWSDARPRVPAYLERAMPVLRQLEAQLVAGTAAGAGPFFGGATPGLGDLGLFATVDMILAIAPKNTIETQLPQLCAWYAAVAALPGVEEYLANRPQLGMRSLGKPGSLMHDGNKGHEA